MTPLAPHSVPRDEDPSPSKDHGPEITNFNYYFLPLAVLFVIAATILFPVLRRKFQTRWRYTVQPPRARDVEAWPGTRGIIHGKYRKNDSISLRRNEGLNELGEAPPPYQPKTDAETEPETEATIVLVTMPPRTLPVDESERLEPPRFRGSELLGDTHIVRQEAARDEEERGMKTKAEEQV
jgi:hypothetical protein